MGQKEIQVRLRCFSHLRHQLGREEVILSLPEGSTTDDLERQVRTMLGATFSKMIFRTAVNQDLVCEPVQLADNDEVALLPPMQGG